MTTSATRRSTEQAAAMASVCPLRRRRLQKNVALKLVHGYFNPANAAIGSIAVTVKTPAGMSSWPGVQNSKPQTRVTTAKMDADATSTTALMKYTLVRLLGVILRSG
jgi:hypothetical protein